MREGARLADFGLLAMDMDSTLICIECIDEIADFAGRKAEVAAVTAAAMRGEIDWPESLKRRVARARGPRGAALERVYAERLRFNPGAERSSRRRGARREDAAGLRRLHLLHRPRARALELDYAYSNVLVVEGGKLAGTHHRRRWSTPRARPAHVARLKGELGLAREQVLAIGDGANDLPMMAEAGTSIAYHAKPVVKAKARPTRSTTSASTAC